MNKLKVIIINLPIPAFYNKVQKGNCNIFRDYFSSLIVNKNFNNNIELIKINREVLESYNNRALIDKIKKTNPDVVCFSSYLWNIERNIDIAKKLKEANIITITGGPEIDYKNKYIFESNAFDYYIKGEGEYELLMLLQKMAQNKKVEDKFIITREQVNFNFFLEHYIEKTDDFLYDGLFYLEIERGCPYNCCYCLYGKSREKITTIDDILYKKAIDKIYNNDRVNELYLLAPTLNRNRKNFKSYLEYIAKKRDENKREVKLFGELRVEFLTEEEIRLLSLAGCKEIEYGIQTLDIKKYDDLNRKVIKFNFIELTKRLIDNGIEPIIDFIIGLSGESYNDIINSIDILSKHNILKYAQFYQLHLLSGSAIREEFDKKNYSYQEKSPYFIINNDKIDYNDVKKIYYYLESEKELSYYDDFFEFREENFYVIKRESEFQKLFETEFYHTASFIYLDCIDKEYIIKFYTDFFRNNPEIFHHTFLFSERFDLKFLDRLYYIFSLYKNYYDYFKDNINFNSKFSQSKRITLLVKPDIDRGVLDELIEEHIVDYVLSKNDKTNFSNILDKLKKDYKNYGISSFIFNNYNIKKYEFVKTFPKNEM